MTVASLLGEVPVRAHYREYLLASYAPNTRLAYEKDLKHFRSWGGRIPCSPSLVCRYLAAFAGKLAYSTLRRRVAALHDAHVRRGSRSPIRTELVSATLRGIGRVHSRRQRQVNGLLPEHLTRMLRLMRGAVGSRDGALLLLGFFGGFRRSELVSLDRVDIQACAGKCLIIRIRKSKTDQDGVGRAVRIPVIKGTLCVGKAMDRWLRIRGTAPGPLFTRFSPMGSVSQQRLSGVWVAQIVKSRVAQIGLDPRLYSGHSLRAGFVTAAARLGAATWQIRQQTGHKSDATVGRYVRDMGMAGESAARLAAKHV
jgi:integrase